MAERLKAPVSKTGIHRKVYRGFESLSLRHFCDFIKISRKPYVGKG